MVISGEDLDGAVRQTPRWVGPEPRLRDHRSLSAKPSQLVSKSGAWEEAQPVDEVFSPVTLISCLEANRKSQCEENICKLAEINFHNIFYLKIIKTFV